MSHSLLQQIRRSTRRHHLLPPGTSVLVGLSGGSDSVALTFLLQDLARHGGFRVAGVAHLNHQIRTAAGRDEMFCRALAERLGLPIIVESVDVPGYAGAQRLSLEDAARRLRYDFLARAATQLAATRIAVGHTQDDQAETFLLKLARGAGLTGLGGIYPRRDAVIRPLLDVSRADLQAYLRARGESWVDDETNADVVNPRNRVRHHVLPELEAAYGGPTRPALARAAALLREDGQWLDEEAERRFAVLGRFGDATWETDAARLASEPPAMRRRILLKALRALAGGHEVGLEHVEAALEVAAGHCAGADLPRCRVELRGEKLVLFQQDAGAK